MLPPPAWYWSRELELYEIARRVGRTRISGGSYISTGLSGLIVERHFDSVRAWYPRELYTCQQASTDFSERLTTFKGPGYRSTMESVFEWIHTFHPVLRRCIRCGGYENGPNAGHHPTINGCPSLPRAK